MTPPSATPTRNTDRNATLFERARKAMPGGVSHELRYKHPFPMYVTRAEGAHKWDAEGRKFIDYKMGSASQMLGHCPPAVVEAVAEQAQRTPFTADCHELEIEWAEIVNSLFPSSDLCRFTASGTEATMLAVRIGRAYSGRDQVLRIDGHYHGWHDHLLKGSKPAFNAPTSHGIPAPVADLVTIVPANLNAVTDAIRRDERIGTVVVEASGANYGSVPLPAGFLKGIRELTQQHGIVLIFDEIITGFRWSAGGLQARDGIVPDLTTLSKILTGGLPGGAVAGKREIMRWLDPTESQGEFAPGVSHKGTFNASPLVAAGAVAALRILRDGKPQCHADTMAARMRDGLSEILNRRCLAGAAYGESSTFHLYLGQCESRSIEGLSAQQIRTLKPELVNGLRLGLNERGVDLMSHTSGVTASAHQIEHIDLTLQAFDDTLGALSQQGLLHA